MYSIILEQKFHGIVRSIDSVGWDNEEYWEDDEPIWMYKDSCGSAEV
jgi:hypothetical protein